MLANYFLVAVRNLLRQKSYAFINIVGLALGLACSLLILLWVADELSVDRYHTKLGRIHQVMELQTYSNGQSLVTASTPGVMVPAMVEEFPEIEFATRVTWGNSYRLFKSDEEYYTASMLQVDPSFFSIFTVHFVEGSAETAFDNLESIVISDELAKRVFGDEPALGKVLQYGNRTSVVISGVFKSRNDESSLKYDALMPFEHWVKTNAWAVNGWGNNGLRSFLLLREGVDKDSFEEKFEGYIKTKAEWSVVDLFLLPHAERYLRGDFSGGKRVAGRIAYVRIFSLVGAFILLIACINFMNLATARSARRAKEIGVRKAVGANQGALVGQFMAESLLVSVLAMIVALVLAELALPYFNELTGKAVDIHYSSPRVLGSLFAITALTGLLAGMYPALYMASFNTVRILKGSFRTGKSASRFRHGLVVFQFVLSTAMIVVTMVIYRQMDFMLSKDLGLQKEHVVHFWNPAQITRQYEAFRTSLLELPGVQRVSRSNQNPISLGNSTGDVSWDGMGPDDKALFQTLAVDYDFTETLGIPILDGRSFDRSFGSDSASVIINQMAARKMGMEHPVGNTLRFWGSEFTVVGMVPDFHTGPLRGGLEPLIILHQPQNTGMSLLRLSPANMPETLEAIRAAYKTFEQRIPLEFNFLDESYVSMYRSEAAISTLSRWFAGFAIVISCLGLFGLASFTAEQRTKEIGVRKVLGASVMQLVALMTGGFSRLVLLAFLIAVPIAWYFMDIWLQEFAFRIELDGWIFLLAGAATLAVAWLTVFWQCLRAAMVNPVEVLKYE